MARVHTAIARKDYPQHGIKKGQKYWYWTPYRQGKRMSATQPKPSQVASNETVSSFLAIQEGLEADLSKASTVEEIRGILESAADDVDQVAEELREKASNIEDGFQHETELSSQFNEQADEVESWAGDLRDAVDDEAEEPGEEPEEPDRQEFESDEEYETAKAEYAEAREEYDDQVQAWEDALENAKSAAEEALSSAPDL